MKLKYTIFALIVLATSCIRPPEYPVEPVIEYIGIDKTTMTAGSGNEDFVFLTFKFTDGDGDIGAEAATEDEHQAFYFHSLIGKETKLGSFGIPLVPEQGSGNGITGEVTVKINTICCLQTGGCDNPIPGLEEEKFRFLMYIEDRAGNRSNWIESDEITLTCF